MDNTDEHGHIAFFYGPQHERMRTLAQYFREGLEKNELGIFVTPDTPKKVIEAFRGEGFSVAPFIDKGAFRIFEMEATYLPHGKFVGDYMLKNVANFIEDAKAIGYSGLRTAGEMVWLHNWPEAWADAFEYEDNVNSLGHGHPEFTGLCLYPVQIDSPVLLKNAIRTHPSFIYKNKLNHNPLYHSSDLSKKSDEDIKELLANP